MCHLHLKLCTPAGRTILDPVAILLSVLAFQVDRHAKDHCTGYADQKVRGMETEPRGGKRRREAVSDGEQLVGEVSAGRKPKSLKQLASQNAGLANIEISDKNIKAFSRVAKKYHVDFALKKDTAAEQPRYLVFFKSRDADAITAAFQEFASRKMSREKKPSIRDRLTQAKEQAAEKVEHRTIDREKVKVKDRSVQR